MSNIALYRPELCTSKEISNAFVSFSNGNATVGGVTFAVKDLDDRLKSAIRDEVARIVEHVRLAERAR